MAARNLVSDRKGGPQTEGTGERDAQRALAQKGDEVAGVSRKPHNEELRDLQSS
jgi:hypothetical protein